MTPAQRYAAAIAVSLIVLATGSAVAQDSGEAPVYRVELLVFRHLTAAVADDELFIAPDRLDEDIPRNSGFERIRRNELKLLEAYETMRRSRDYSPLLHVGWIQPGLPRADAAAYPVAGAAGGYNVRGTARLILERRLRLDVDLTMNGAAGESYHLVDGRPLRRGDLHYFDHPRFGVIAVVTREKTD